DQRAGSSRELDTAESDVASKSDWFRDWELRGVRRAVEAIPVRDLPWGDDLNLRVRFVGSAGRGRREAYRGCTSLRRQWKRDAHDGNEQQRPRRSHAAHGSRASQWGNKGRNNRHGVELVSGKERHTTTDVRPFL